MAQVRTFAVFESNLPDEAEWDEQGRPSVPPGKPVVSILAEGLEARGASVSEPVQHRFYGWRVDVVYEGLEAWCLLQYPGPWLLLIEEKWPGVARLIRSRKRPALAFLVQEVHSVLKGAACVSAVRWFTKEEFAAGCEHGAEAPY